MSVAISMVFTFAATQLMNGAGYVLSFLILAAFIFIGIIFDMVGVAVTAADERPFHSMASHKESGAVEAIRLIKNADKVSSVCNDVVGDISGIVSGTTSAAIAANLMRDFSSQTIMIQLCISAAVAGLTIGGKAVGKGIAMKSNIQIVHFAGRIIGVKNRFLKRRKKR
jgi:CBS domain containing-hemolysin-like protein